MNDLVLLSTTNEPYIRYTEKCLMSFNRFHPDIKFYLACINVSKEKIDYLNSLHSNLVILSVNQNFEKRSKEATYSSTIRCNLIPDLMRSTGKDVFWVDADIKIEDSLLEFFNYLKNYDVGVRIKKNGSSNLDPDWRYPIGVSKPPGGYPDDLFRCNCGMIYIKNTQKNINILQKEWIPELERIGRLTWCSEQNAFSWVIHNHLHNIKDITITSFPDRFNGIDTNPISVIKHMKGVKKCSFGDDEINRMKEAGIDINFLRE